MNVISSPSKTGQNGTAILFTLCWNQRSRCSGNPEHDQPEYALVPTYNFQTAAQALLTMLVLIEHLV